MSNEEDKKQVGDSNADPYEESIGIKHYKLGKVEHDIFPIEGDNLRIARIMDNSRKNGLEWLYSQFNILYFEMVTRKPTEYEIKENSIRVPVPEEHYVKLKRWIEMNQNTIQKDMLIMFGWQTKKQQEKLDDIDGDTLKKLIGV